MNEYLYATEFLNHVRELFKTTEPPFTRVHFSFKTHKFCYGYCSAYMNGHVTCVSVM